ncbi:unnamed protein product [Alopecurus aequalis]
MAGVLDALASYVTDMLTEMAKEEAALLIGVSDEVDKLGVKLGDLKNFLADADRRNINDISVQVWVEELKRAMYLAADILDLCQLKALENGPPKDMGCLNPLLFCMRNPPHAHDIGSRIKALNEKLDAICTRGRGFNFIKLEAYKYQRTTRNPHISRKTDPLLERSSVVGDKIEEDTRVLVEMLTKDVDHEIDCIMVVAIVGVGGIGKTTLSKKVFNSEAIQGKFSKKIWLSITQEFNEVDLLRTAITASKGNIPGPGVGSEDKALLLPALASAIKDQKFFLVLDDMWGDKEWNNLLKAPFSYGAAGSRVLVTTRHDIIARGMKAVAPYHHVDKLGSEDAWSLLKRQVLTTEKHEPDIEILKDIGLQLIKICDGVPLAIKVMGGLLCQREKEYRAWQKVLSEATCRGTRDDVPEKDDKDKGIIEEVFDELRPPPCIEDIFIYRYFGRQLPTWMMMSAETPFNSLRILSLTDLPYCGQLPDGWSQLPCLDLLEIVHAPGIMRLGIEFVQPYSHRHYASSHTVAGLPRLHKLSLISMVEWDEWDWEERVQAMPSLEELYIRTCKLRCIPPGLAFHARSLKKLTIWSAKGVSSLENFASVVDLDLFDIPCLTMISNFPKLQKLEIKYCPNLESLEEMNALRRLVLELVYKQERLPLFLQTIKPSHLQLNCRLASLASMAAGKSGAEWENFSHIQNVEAYSNLETGDNRWHVFYTREPYSMKTNIDLQSLKRYCAGYEDRSEEEWMCHDPTVTLEEIEEE